MQRIVVLVSGRGSNLRAIADAAQHADWGARVVAVIASRADAPALDLARQRGIVAGAVDHRDFADRADFDDALARAVDAHAPDIVALAGFMRVLGDAFVARYAGRLVNIHPSLLPAFAGLHTHRRAIEAGCKFAGATVHFVTPTLDHGPIIAQAAVPVRPDDSEATLAQRVLASEHRLFPLALGWLARGELRTEGGVVRHRDGLAQWLIGD